MSRTKLMTVFKILTAISISFGLIYLMASSVAPTRSRHYRNRRQINEEDETTQVTPKSTTMLPQWWEELTSEEIDSILYEPLKLKERLIKRRRHSIRADLWDYNETVLNGLIPERYGRPLRNIIISTWRSGSSFVGELVASHPGSLYLYEPFMHMHSKQIHTEEEAKEAIQVMKELFSCQFTHPEYTKDGGLYTSALLSRSPFLKTLCKDIPGACEDPKFISRVCRLHPFQLLKTVRFPLKFAEPLLNDEMLGDVRIILLIRDPRAIMNSRSSSSWWCSSDDCIDESRLCSDQISNYIHAERLLKKYPNKLLVLRHEDISLKPQLAAKKILSHFKLPYHPSVKHFVKEHTTTTSGDEFSTFRDSSQIPFKWMETYAKDLNTLEQIQKKCENALEAWGYKSIKISISLNTTNSSDNSIAAKEEFSADNPLGSPPWKSMEI